MPPERHRPGLAAAFTLIEVTLVVAVMIGLISVTFVGVAGYKEAANRAICIQNVANVQRAMRAYCNLNELAPGQEFESLKDEIVGAASYIVREPDCPSGGRYVYLEEVVPQVGETFIRCSIEDHAPRDTASW